MDSRNIRHLKFELNLARSPAFRLFKDNVVHAARNMEASIPGSKRHARFARDINELGMSLINPDPIAALAAYEFVVRNSKAQTRQWRFARAHGNGVLQMVEQTREVMDQADHDVLAGVRKTLTSAFLRHGSLTGTGMP